MLVRLYCRQDRASWLHMRAELWPNEGENDADRWAARLDAVTVIAETATGQIIGFAEAGERPYADGCDSSPVAFLEGWYVAEACRGQGYGTSLLGAVTDWAKSRGLTELASDALLDDQGAISAHLASGFQEIERSVKFRKSIS